MFATLQRQPMNVWLLAALIAALFATTMSGLVASHGAPDMWWQMMMSPLHMVAGVFGGG